MFAIDGLVILSMF